VARHVAKVILEKFGTPWKYEWWTTPLAKSFPLTREGKQGELLWDPKVKTVNKLEHNHPDIVVKMPEGQVLILEFAVCRDDMVVERATEKERRYQLLARDWQQKHGGAHPTVLPIVIGTRGVVPKATVQALQKLKKWGFDVSLSKLQKAAVIGSIKIVQKTIRSYG
jgi:hypothetical protein